ncbi:TetR/AcrR family transcriptional regulator [Labrenzia aggregata]|uniref:TetR/AcrR family transcriptional regulator n=1 Tax=Roseibium aggregatum TaxID=187304 RepID=A0A939IZP9_9HYPH|nr:TetR/AcrR family transcriptional regulator [Roseibium aggregatum]MBN9670271.1 TetR/AcrR family transcriptional regulator [Roseibium aggregatum]
MTDPLIEKTSGWRGTREIWLQAAYQALLESGIDGVKVMPLAERLGLSRTSFYGHFSDRDDLLGALITLWQAKNTGNLIKRTEDYAETVTEAMLNVFDLWLLPDLFDSRLEFAVRNWAHSDERLSVMMEDADRIRVEALEAMFLRFGYDDHSANVRANTVYQTQIGYISMKKDGPLELLEPRLKRMPHYAEIFTGQTVSEAEIARFRARHIAQDPVTNAPTPAALP